MTKELAMDATEFEEAFKDIQDLFSRVRVADLFEDDYLDARENSAMFMYQAYMKLRSTKEEV